MRNFLLNTDVETELSPESDQPILEVQTLEQVGDDAWDDYLEHSQTSFPTQKAIWKYILKKVYGISGYFLAVTDNGQIQGVLPLYRVKNPVTGDSLQSMFGAICANTPQAAQALISAADQLAKDLKVQHLHLRDSRQPVDYLGVDSIEVQRGVRLHLPSTTQTAWENMPKGLHKEFRYGINKGSITSVTDYSLVDTFYEFLLHFNHQLGTPLFSNRFLHHVTEAFPGKYVISLGYHEDTIVSGVLALIHKTTLFPLWGGALRKYFSMMPTHQVYWEMMRSAIQKDLTLIDFGRSSYPSPQFSFKAKWGDETYPIYQCFKIYRGRTPSDLNISQALHKNRALSLVSNTWTKLPLPVVRILGPFIRRSIPFG